MNVSAVAKEVARQSVLEILRAAMHACASIRLTDGESVQAHSLWCAHQAVAKGCGAPVVVAALFHDIGHYLCAGDPELATYETDRQHAELGALWLSRWFAPEICQPIALHIDAKRYLATTDLDYRLKLGRGSMLSLEHQGGLMSDKELESFRGHKYSDVALLIRQFDDTPCTVKTLQPYQCYEPMLVAAMR